MLRRYSVVLDQQSVLVQVDDSGSLTAQDVVVVDPTGTSTFTLAGWRGLSLGVGGGRAFAWSARELLVLLRTPPAAEGAGPGERDHTVDVVRFDDDVVVVFRRGRLWVVVCETSVRVLDDARMLSRLELGDAVDAAWWSGSLLEVRLVEGGRMRIEIAEDGHAEAHG